MKVFTVGLDQKPPLKDGASAEKLPEKDGGSPPPGYIASTKVAHIPLPMGPELPQPPIIMRKSRGYKGILMVMLAVFLMALFALTLSEIAYNRQRDENFFRLRWAELKHRLGYDNNYDYYHRANAAINPDRLYSLHRNSEALLQNSEPTSSSTTSAPSTTTEPVVVIDTFPQRPRIFQSKSSSEQQPDGPLGMIRDARLQFLKTILQKIKQHAEDMGFDGTMQVSVIEVEPQGDDASPFSSPFGASQMSKPQQLHPLLSNFFPHFPIDEQSPALKPNSPSFLDGFGEIHQPTFLQNNQVAEENRAHQSGPFGPFPHEDDQQGPPRNGEFGDFGPVHWPRPNSNPFRPDFFGPPTSNWPAPVMPQQQSQQGFPQPPHILPRPPSFDRWSGQNLNQPNMVDSDDQQQPGQGHPQQPHPPPPMIQIFPNPMMPPMMGPQHGPEQHSGETFGQDSSSSSSSSSSNASPSQEVVGEIYGRKFGRMLQDIIANRIQGFQHLQQMSPLMAPPSIQQQSSNSQSDQRPRMPNFGEGMQGPSMQGPPMGSPMPFQMGPNPGMQNQQQMAMPPQWWQPPPQPPMPMQQQGASGQMTGQMNQQVNGDQKGDKGQAPTQQGMLPPPPPIIFFPMQQPGGMNQPAMNQQQGQQQQPPQFPGNPFPENKDMMMGQRKEGQPVQQLQFPMFKNLVPPEDRIQIEPPQNFPNGPQPLGMIEPQRQPPRPVNNDRDEPNMMKTVVDNNMGGPRGWTHQLPKPSSDSSSNSEENRGPQQAPAQSSGPNEELPPMEEAPAVVMGNTGSTSSEPSKEAPAGNDEDVWLTGPPRRGGQVPPRHPSPMVDSSAEQPNTPVDFPAVKFPSMTQGNDNAKPNEQPAKPNGNSESKPSDAMAGPQNDHLPQQQPVLSNPVFFQVDEPTSVEQRPPPAVAA